MRGVLTRLVLLLTSLSVPLGTALADDGTVNLPRYPSISPDANTIVFSWRGDLWSVPTAGGLATRLTAHPGDDLRSAWSPDGQQIAFSSDRSGWDNIHLMNADGTAIRRLTDTDRSLQLSGFSADGRHVLFGAAREGDVYRADRPYRVSVDGGAIERIHDAFGTWPQQEGDTVIFTRGESRWDRRHYRGPDNRNIWRHDLNTNAFQQLTDWAGNDGRARVVGNRVYFLSDREFDTFNLYVMDLDQGEPSVQRLSDFRDADVHEFDVSRDGSTAVLHAWDTLYTLDLRSGSPEPTPLAITAPQDEDDDFQRKDVSREVTEAALSPDAKVMAFVAYGDVYVRNIEEGHPTRQVTTDVARDRDIAWSPDGLTLYFSSDRDGTDSIYAASVALTRSEIHEKLEPKTDEPAEDDEEPEDEDPDDDEEESDDESETDEDEPNPADRWHDAVRFNIEPVVQSSLNDREPRPSPDGKHLSFRRTRGDIMVLDLESGQTDIFFPSWNLWIDWSWSPDGSLIAYSAQNENFNTEVWIAPIDHSFEPVNVSMHPDNDWGPRWSADGKILAFLSDRINDETDVWMVYLDRDIEALPEFELEKYHEDAAKAAKDRKPLPPPDDEDEPDDEDAPSDEPLAASLELDDAYLRLQRVTSFSGDEGNLEITPGGDRLVFTAGGGAAGDGGLFSIKWDGSEKKRLTGSADVQHLSLDGSKVIFVSGGRAATVPVEGGDSENIDLAAEKRIDLEAQAVQMFAELSRELGMTFYHPTMKDLDWDTLSQSYLELARRSRTSSEFVYVAMRLLGELNGSHLGVYPPGDDNPNSRPNGRLAIDATPVRHNGAPAQRVDRVVPRGPTDAGTMALKAGDIITEVEFEPLSEDLTLDAALKGRVGKETILTVVRDVEPNAPTTLNIIVEPISYSSEVALRYDDWQRHNAALVSEWSGGRVGYLHIRAMGSADLVEFERDLYAAAYKKDGLLIDVRNNGGGWTADRVLTSLMTKPHAYTIPRGDDSGHTEGYPQDRLYIQRFTKPANMLCNEKSFSNAEIVAHAFKTLGRGTLVGEKTYGGVISTGGWTLVDGTWVRRPFRGWYVVGGMDMENNGATPDIRLPARPSDEAAEGPYGYDRQLKAAVDDIMKRIDN